MSLKRIGPQAPQKQGIIWQEILKKSNSIFSSKFLTDNLTSKLINGSQQHHQHVYPHHLHSSEWVWT